MFQKIKIKEDSIKEEDIIYKMQKDLKNENNVENKEKLRKIEDKLVKLKSNDLHKIVKEEIEKVDCEAGGLNSGHLWKIKSKLKPKMSNKYTAIVDENGKLLTSEEDIDNETVKNYTKVLENRKISPNLEEYQKDREELCEIRIKEGKRNITPNWTAENVRCVVKELKKNKTEILSDDALV